MKVLALCPARMKRGGNTEPLRLAAAARVAPSDAPLLGRGALLRPLRPKGPLLPLAVCTLELVLLGRGVTLTTGSSATGLLLLPLLADSVGIFETAELSIGLSSVALLLLSKLEFLIRFDVTEVLFSINDPVIFSAQGLLSMGVVTS